MFMYFLFLLIALATIIKLVHAGEDKGALKEGIKEGQKYSTEKYGEASSEYLAQYEYNLNLAPSTFSTNQAEAEESAYKYNQANANANYLYLNNKYKYGSMHLLSNIPDDVCSCAITLFVSYKDELACYDDCSTQRKKKCACDFYDQTLPLKVLCYDKNCNATKEDAMQNIFQPLVLAFFIVGAFFFIILMFAPFVVPLCPIY